MSTQVQEELATKSPSARTIDMKLEVVVIPVSDNERAVKFYSSLGWRQDVTPPGSGVFQFTPPGSACSVQWGVGTTAKPGTAQGLWLIVSDIQAALDKLASIGVAVDKVFHFGDSGPADGLDPQRRTYRSLAAFHLEKLAEAGLLETSFSRRAERAGGPGAGRPNSRFCLSLRGVRVGNAKSSPVIARSPRMHQMTC